MKLTNGKCPYCSRKVSEKPRDKARQINCQGCGRLLNIPSRLTLTSRAENTHLKTFEPGLILTALIGFAFGGGSTLLMALFTAMSFVIMLLLWTNEEIPLLSGFMNERVAGSAERLRVFPFELYLIACWAIWLALTLVRWEPITDYMFSFTMFIAAFMSIQANRFYRESKVTSPTVSPLDFSLFINIMMNPVDAFDKRKVDSGEGISQEHFFTAAAEKEEKEKKIAADFEEVALKRAVCINDRKSWEKDIQHRYNQWLEEESNRLIQETRGGH